MSAVRDNLPEGPREPPLVQLFEWIFRPDKFLERCQSRYGDSFTIRFPRYPPIVLITDPLTVKQVFTGEPDQFAAGQANIMLKPTLGAHSLLLLDGPRHHAERKLMMPAFHGDRMHAYTEIMREATHRAIDGDGDGSGWPVGRYFPLHPQMKRITMEVILRAVFGLEGGANFQRLPRMIDQLLHLGNHPLFIMMLDHEGRVRARELQEWIRFSPWSSFRRVRDEVDDILYREIATRRQTAGKGQDVLSLLLSARDEAGAPLDDQALRDEMLSLLVAGHKTTATTLTWVVYRLLTEPGVWSKAHAEVEGGGHDYLDCVVKETLRLNPTIPIILRRLQTTQRIGDRELPAGVLVAPAIYLTHRRADLWLNPERFDPERFSNKPTPYEYFPFGGGTRRCLGMAFALYELRVVLSEIVKRVQLRLPEGYHGRLVRSGITFALSDGLPVQMEAHPAQRVP